MRDERRTNKGRQGSQPMGSWKAERAIYQALELSQILGPDGQIDNRQTKVFQDLLDEDSSWT